METIKEDDIKNYNIFNALNLVNPELGELYLKNGYNPFEEDFKLNIGYIQDLLDRNKDKTPILTEAFLEKPTKEVKKNFELALQNNNNLKELLQNNINDNIFDEDTKKQVKEIIIFLKNREQLLAKAILKLKKKFANPLLEYQNVCAIDKKLSELLKESYLEDFKLEVAHFNFVQFCKTKAKLEKIKKEQNQAKEKEEQKQIQKENKQKNQPIQEAKIDNNLKQEKLQASNEQEMSF